MERKLTRALPLLPMAVAGMLLAPIPVAAHAELVSSSPAADAELETPPTEVVVVFDGELDPQVSELVVTDAGGAVVGGGEVDLQVAERNELRGAVDIDGPGTYTVSWTAAAADGHAEEGAFAFTVLDAEDSGESPDTALPRTGDIGLAAILGLLLVLAAMRIAIARVAMRPVSRP